MDVAVIVAEARRRRGWTQRELARAAGTSQAAISDIEQIDPHDLELMRRNLLLTPAQRLAQLSNRMRLRGLARR